VQGRFTACKIKTAPDNTVCISDIRPNPERFMRKSSIFNHHLKPRCFSAAGDGIIANDAVEITGLEDAFRPIIRLKKLYHFFIDVSQTSVI
jgi:hypothetical protein